MADVPRKRKKIGTTVPASTGPTSAPGVVSALRPVRRALPVLGKELQLLRRLVYKNKNQHKGSHWWRKVVEVDRITSKTLAVVHSWLDLFGKASGKDDTHLINDVAITSGLEQAARPLKLVAKSVQVTLDTASVLEQILDLKAFMAFTVTVTALIARVFALCSALMADLEKVIGVFWRVVQDEKLHTNGSLPAFVTKYRVPRHIATVAQETPPPSAAVSELERGPAREDFGDVVSRRELQSLQQSKIERHELSTGGVTASKAKPRAEAMLSTEVEKAPTSSLVRSENRVGVSSEKVVSSKARESRPAAAVAKSKKLKKTSKDRDEIDDIFG
ncbi:hypothetical protein ACM66B_003740 [Microbotryomycetes sp. NB124-2]